MDTASTDGVIASTATATEVSEAITDLDETPRAGGASLAEACGMKAMVTPMESLKKPATDSQAREVSTQPRIDEIVQFSSEWPWLIAGVRYDGTNRGPRHFLSCRQER